MTSVFDYNNVGNPKIFEQNRLMPHTEKKTLYMTVKAMNGFQIVS